MAGTNIEAIYRLTPLQEGILFHTLEDPASGVYFEQYTCALDGDLDVASMRRAWQTAVARHPVLRTLFTWENRDKPLQIVRQRVELPFETLDWSHYDETELERRLQSWLRLDRDRGFDLASAPLVRIALIRTAPRRHRLVWSFHHLLIDGWSMRLILDEVLASYEAFASGSSVNLPDAPPFADFVAWLEQRDTSKEAAFWRDTLSGYTTPVCPDAGTFERDEHPAGAPNGVCEHRIDAVAFDRLRDAARSRRLTMNTLVLAAWALLLSRYADRDDVVFGTTVAGRPPELAASERIAGLFINTLPLRLRVDNGERVLDYLRAVQSAQIATREFEQTALVDAQRQSDVAPGTPLFETIVVYENFPPRDSDVTQRQLAISDETYVEYSNFPLALLVVPEEELRLLAVHDPRRFGAAAVARILAQLDTTLASLCDKLDGVVGDVAVLAQPERQQLLEEWNRTGVDTRPLVPVHKLIEERARCDPQAVAIVDGEGELSYGALDLRANQLAHLLVARGVKANTAVVILAERNAAAITGLLAVLKAGGAYVPVDAKYPADRLRQILADLGREQTPLVLTQSHLVARLPADHADVLLLDVDLTTQPCHAPDMPFDPAQLAYVIYTSGSTGTPKGVMISHANLFNSTRARDDYYNDSPRSWLMLSSLATDSSVAGVFWTLTSGAELVLPAGRAEQDIETLAELIAERGTTHTLCVPSLYALILENAPSDKLAPLRTVIVAGEACPAALVSEHHKRLPQTELHNEYGPSEATVWATAGQLDAQAKRTGVTIGRPIANVCVYVLDENMRPLPIGASGELFIGGANVARGYLHRPDKTAEVFVADPFSDNAHARLYKSGDRARWRSDGRLEFVGRVDHQLKVRGFRVEPGEIEAALNAHPLIDEAVVLLDDSHDDAIAAGLACLETNEADRLIGRIEALSEEDAMRAARETQQETSS